jgi:hypothetical protein
MSFIKQDVINLSLWNKWFIFNNKNSNITIYDNTINILTKKNKQIIISDVQAFTNKVIFTINAKDNIINASFIFNKDKSLVKGVFQGEVLSPIMGGYIAVFVRSSLLNILKVSLHNLVKI